MNQTSYGLEEFTALFPFSLDDFQLQAIEALNQNCSVVVCAPTGSGKTLVGEYVIHRALARQRRVFYTTPLKALSNQKLRDFREQFGHEQVGLLTGDVSINRDAPILVMTTEIFRNMLYGTPIGEVGTSLAGVESVVLDECHYMNDRQRGTVWEESIIYCPAEIQLVALSATIANGEQLTDWITAVHGETRLIYSDWRPVPLQFYFCQGKGLFPLLNSEKTHLNARLLRSNPPPVRGRKRPEFLNLAYVVNQLAQRQMLPAIYFIFSRRGCDQALQQMGGVNLLNPDESQALNQILDEFLARNGAVVPTAHIAPLRQGIAAHHAGVLPLWKTLIEELFQDGLIKVVFATETLAAGINMPARTTVLSSLSKRTDSGHRLLTASEFLQISGRAGRRGMDEIGHVVTLQTPFEGAREAAYLATVGPDPLVSQFTPSYGMVLNLLQRHTLEEARDLIERSFGQYLATLHLAPQRQAIATLEAELEEINQRLDPANPQALSRYQKLRERLRQEQRLLKTLSHQAEALAHEQRVPQLLVAQPGTLVCLDTTELHPKVEDAYLTAILAAKLPGPGQFPLLGCWGVNNRFYVVALEQVKAIGKVAPVVFPAWPTDISPKRGYSWNGPTEAADIAKALPEMHPDVSLEVQAQAKKIAQIEAEMATLPVGANPGTALRLRRRREKLLTDLVDRQEKLSQQAHPHWEDFLSLIAILQEFGGLEDLVATPLGQLAASLRGENELWLALAFDSGALDELPPQQLAAACAALVTETPRPDSWTDHALSAPVEEALSSLRPIRRQLFQAQRRKRVIFPIWLETGLVGLVEHWALGIEWSALCQATNLDQGDLVRLLRRTLDVLSQIPHAPHASPTLKKSATQARQLLDRFPVNDLLVEDPDINPQDIGSISS
ncbi:DEAD/DEAH box helicase [Thermosynechococcaceae cyanobacterium BACA0444]|uniref:DEAD/DEAH box helicase n=1 Tax=Pseudocalidococcus azoricus BACA0444 TaxID=2918990 RepID=A0AAE4JUS0_9CYAN|nr:DEAD/DEAH box helicase [Pseudocalidococcus azoricus]MDS3859605.1 DEAD/DEAH box helicase [Pseudocalidococcus azoricus BACA0444]